MAPDPEELAAEIVARVRSQERAPGTVNHAVVVRWEGDSYSNWYELFVVARHPGLPDLVESEVGLVDYEAGDGKRVARATGFLVAQALGVTAHLEDVTSPPYSFVLPAKIEPPRFAPLACAELDDAVAQLRLAPGFASQLSGLVDDAWEAATPVCRQKDLRTYMLLKEHAPTLDRRAFIEVDLDGPMSIWAALSLAELGWAPMFLLGPALHRGYDWRPVLGALKYVARPLKAALERLDEDAPVAQITDTGAGVLHFRREAHEDPALPPFPESDLEKWSFMRERILEAHASAIAERVRVVLPRVADIAAHHHCKVVLCCHDEVAVDGLQPRPEHDVVADEDPSLPAFQLLLNPYVDRA